MTEPDDDPPVLVTADEASVLAHVAPGTIRVWRYRGKLRAAGRDTAGRLLFALADVIRLDRGDTPKSGLT